MHLFGTVRCKLAEGCCAHVRRRLQALQRSNACCLYVGCMNVELRQAQYTHAHQAFTAPMLLIKDASVLPEVLGVFACVLYF
jgi:hypothetical protein